MVEDIRNRQATLFAVSPQLPKFLSAIVKKYHLTFNLLYDQNNRLAEQFRLVWQLPEELRQVYSGFGIDLERFNDDQSWKLPMPARFIIDRDGTIADAAIYPDHTVRSEPAEIVEILDNL